MILKQKSKITGDFQFLKNPKKARKLLILKRKEGFPRKYFKKRPQVIDFKGKNENLGVYP
jgi:hypothetical protein